MVCSTREPASHANKCQWVFFEVDGCEVLEPDELPTVISTFASCSNNAATPPAAGPGPEGRTTHFDIPKAIACYGQPNNTFLIIYWFGEDIVEHLA